MTQTDDAEGHPAGPLDSAVPPTVGVPHLRHLAHLHWQICARPAGFAQIRGILAVLWLHELPPTEEEVWRSNQVRIAAALAAQGGTAHVG